MAINARRKVYAVLRGSFSSDGISSYIRELIGQRGMTVPIQADALPTVATVEAWDGLDGEVSAWLTLSQITYSHSWYIP